VCDFLLVASYQVYHDDNDDDDAGPYNWNSLPYNLRITSFKRALKTFLFR